MKKSLKGVITGAALAAIVAASAIGYCATREELPQTTPIGYNVDSKQIEGNVDLDGLTNYIRNNHSENWNNFADTLESGEYASLDYMPIPEGEFSAILWLYQADARGQSLPLQESQARKVLSHFNDFKEGIDSGRERYVPTAVIGEIIENHVDFPERLERILGGGSVVENSCGSDTIAQVIKDDNGSIYLQKGNVSVVNDTCSITSQLTSQDRNKLDDLIISSAK